MSKIITVIEGIDIIKIEWFTVALNVLLYNVYTLSILLNIYKDHAPVAPRIDFFEFQSELMHTITNNSIVEYQSVWLTDNSIPKYWLQSKSTITAVIYTPYYESNVL